MDCSHPHLTHIVNPEAGGISSKIYRCDKCLNLFKVELQPEQITVVFGDSKQQ